jgi:hypothetical protein
MNGWRNSVCKELKKRFPETEFSFINAGIPSTGSTPAAFRIEKDVLNGNSIDLLFIDAAVNDHTNHINPTEQIRGMEGIVKHALNSNPEMNIIILHFIWDGMLEELANGTTPEVILNHEKVAAHYNIPSINLATEVAQRIKAGEFDWETFGGTHPAPFGHSIYANTINKLFNAAWENTHPHKKTPEPNPDAPTMIDPYSYAGGQLIDIRHAFLEDGWIYLPYWNPQINAATRKGFVNVPAIEARDPGAVLHFEFTGSAVGIYHVAGPDAGIIQYSVDGAPFKYKDLFTEWSKNLYIPWLTILENELNPQKIHRLTMRIINRPFGTQGGTACQIMYFAVNKILFTNIKDIHIPLHPENNE